MIGTSSFGSNMIMTIIVSANTTGYVNANDLISHIHRTLPQGIVQDIQLKTKKKKKYARVFLNATATESDYKHCAQLLRESSMYYNSLQINAQVSKVKQEEMITATTESSGDENQHEVTTTAAGNAAWFTSQSFALLFFDWLHSGDGNDSITDINLTSVDRDVVHKMFEAFVKIHDPVVMGGAGRKIHPRRLEGLIMSILRKKKLLRTRSYENSLVVCSFAQLDGQFAGLDARAAAREALILKREQLLANKMGVTVDATSMEPSLPVVPVGWVITVNFNVHTTKGFVQCNDVQIEGRSKKNFELLTNMPLIVPENGSNTGANVTLGFCSRLAGVFRASIIMNFHETDTNNNFLIQRDVIIRSGDADMYEILKPKSAYKKKRRKREKPVDEEKIFGPPKDSNGGGGYSLKGLKPFKPPIDVRELVQSNEMRNVLEPFNNDISKYSAFWQNLLWASELQAYEDIKLFDMENATLKRHGRFLKLYVDGLAEGRPSVLRGDIVNCTWKGNCYKGKVTAVELLDVILEFHPSFHKHFNPSLDVVDVRFTFPRTIFRTSHEGVLRGPSSMPCMLLPQKEHIIIQQNLSRQRIESNHVFNWTSQYINKEQQTAVSHIVKGTLRPLPYIIFGPPGTGKTTTVVEAVYQLARLPNKPKILLVAPSNDATNILLEKLSKYFPPTEMLRILAYSRSIEDFPPEMRPYVRQSPEPSQLHNIVSSVQIVVSTVNQAAKFWCLGVPKGIFDVLCVDEAGHATEPEVIAVAATLMNFNCTGKRSGQLIMAGDPMQLGPIITSDLCRRFGMSKSYMERLILTSEAYDLDDNGFYPEELVTFLVRNYRSHPSILKLPNEMFYRNMLLPCGDKFTTHNMTQWERAPKNGFPIVFHAICGENVREGSSPSWFNPQEAIEVVNYVEFLVKNSRPKLQQYEIGVITPYNRQVQKIRTALKARDIEDVKVGSVETFQGQERRCIILSTVRSDSEHVAHDMKYNLGFVSNAKRFNVAVTRAKALLIVIGNPQVLAIDKTAWLPLLRYCRENGSWLGEEWVEDEEAHNGKEDEWQDVAHESEDEWDVLDAPSKTVEQDGFAFINREE